MYEEYFEKYFRYQGYFYMDNEYFVSLVKFRGDGFRKVIPVKTNAKISLDKFLECSRAVRRLFVSDSIKFGDIICKNIINSGADIIAIKAHNFEIK